MKQHLITSPAAICSGIRFPFLVKPLPVSSFPGFVARLENKSKGDR
jgi:hypothetical protein